MGAEIQVSYSESNDFRVPDDVLNDALSRINREGQVALVDDETGEQFLWPLHQPLDLESLPKDVYSHKLLWVARQIYGAVFQIQSFPDIEETILKNLAISLTAYRHSPEFLAKAASLIQLDEEGFLYNARLPSNDLRVLNYED